ncbi:hypothetical protein [Rhodococcus sp. NPDC058521]|uniref:hypothetical protein n=1 Tax=Rhodococcus sp. NPDC058521 TaxID=3346536 RepID=UPI003663B5CD
MNAFKVCSAISVLCTLVICVYIVPPIVVQGHVDVASGFEMFVVMPTLVAIPVSLVAAVIGVFGLRAPERRRSAPLLCAVFGQIVTWAGIVAVFVWAFGFASTGWELITLPFVLLVGQSFVGVGLLLLRRVNRLAAGSGT